MAKFEHKLGEIVAARDVYDRADGYFKESELSEERCMVCTLIFEF